MTGTHPAVGLRVGGRYVLTHRIAGGGMGEVWRGVDDVLGREVAVKVLHRHYADDPGFLARFRAEARHAAPLSHPGVAAVFDYGEGDDLAYLVMELVAGEPLSARLAREGALPAPIAVPLVQQAAAALQAAHEGGVVHRDIKPANLLLTADDQVKITDFGIARASHLTAITRTGEVVGTVQYLAPEQAVGQSATSSSDIYSLGVVAYEMLTGRRPFQADSAVATAMAHVNDVPEALGDAVPEPVARVVLSALAKDPARRPPTAAAFGRALGTALIGGPLPAELWVDQLWVDQLGAHDRFAGTHTQVFAPLPARAPAARPATRRTRPAGDPQRPDRWWIAVAAAVLTVLLVAAVWQRVHTKPASAASNRPAVAAPATASRSGTTTAAPPTLTLVPARYVGRPATVVRRALVEQGLRVDLRTTTGVRSGRGASGIVVALAPVTDLRPGDVVVLDVAAVRTPRNVQTPRPSQTRHSEPERTRSDEESEGFDQGAGPGAGQGSTRAKDKGLAR